MGVGDFLYYKNENRKFEVRNFVNVVVEDNSLSPYLARIPESSYRRIHYFRISVSLHLRILVSSFVVSPYPVSPYNRIVGSVTTL